MAVVLEGVGVALRVSLSEILREFGLFMARFRRLFDAGGEKKLTRNVPK